MKKLIWTLSALALTGLCFVACEDDEEECEAGKVWDTVTNTCVVPQQQQADCHTDASICSGTKPYCVEVPNGSWTCSGTEKCDDGWTRDNDGTCVSSVQRHDCEISTDCEDGQACGAENYCVAAAEAAGVYRYVRIDDLSSSDRSKDPGADIDAVAIFNPNTGKTGYAGRIVDYKPNADNFIEQIENNKNVAGNPKKILKEPDAFAGSYTNAGLSNDSKCIYRDSNEEFTFVSLGGDGGTITVEMTQPIVNGSRLDILEVGGCKLQNAGNDSDKNAFRETLQIFVSVTEKGESWKQGPKFERSGNKDGANLDKGLLSWTVEGL